MIELHRDRAALLADIEASSRDVEPASDITDPRIASVQARLRLRGHSRDDLFPRLEVVLSDRFVAVPRAQLLVDLLIPLRNALGNAYKHGNAGDPSRTLLVELVLTAKGTVIAMTDEGPGFDVARTLRQFKEHQAYFANHGCGFRNFDRARCTVTYEHGGRTTVICYRPGESSAPSSAGRNPAWMKDLLSAELPEFARNRCRLKTCRVFPLGVSAGVYGHRYALQVEGQKGRPVETRILTGRLHTSEALARADFSAASRLYDATMPTRIRIPRPVARLKSEPCVTLYDVNAWMNLSQYLACRGSLRSVRHASERIGQTLAVFHSSGAAFDRPTARDESLETMMVRAEMSLRSRRGGLELAACFRDYVARHAPGRRTRTHRLPVPIHGSITWDSIHYGTDGKFYLYRFENCRRGDPVLDMAGFAADLFCFCLDRYDRAAYHQCLDALLDQYNRNATQRLDSDELHPYLALALISRLGAPDEESPPAMVKALKTMAAGSRFVPSIPARAQFPAR